MASSSCFRTVPGGTAGKAPAAETLDDPILRATDNQTVQHFVEIREEVFQRLGYIDTEKLRPPTVIDE